MKWITVVVMFFALLVQGCKTYISHKDIGLSKKITIEKWRFSFELPSEKWALSQHPENKETKKETYMYMREAILDSLKREIKPVIGFIFEKVPRDTDVIAYHVVRRVPGAKFERAFTHENGSMVLPLAIGWVLTYIRAGVEHTVKKVDAIDGDIGLQVIMDVTTELFPVVEKEFDYTLKSLRFIPEK